MTTKRMALVPRDVLTVEDRLLHGGKVSRRQLIDVAAAITNPSAFVKALPHEQSWQHQARAAITSLGLEIENE